jgi:hypothetical protein
MCGLADIAGSFNNWVVSLEHLGFLIAEAWIPAAAHSLLLVW